MRRILALLPIGWPLLASGCMVALGLGEPLLESGQSNPGSAEAGRSAAGSGGAPVPGGGGAGTAGLGGTTTFAGAPAWGNFLCGSGGGNPRCSPDMVLAPTLSGGCSCIDRFEASEGPGPSRPALTVASATPWNQVSLSEAESACQAASKRLCSREEWLGACTGGDSKRAYPYGTSYIKTACLTAENGSPPAADQTGAHPLCEGGVPGLMDMVGNVAEWTSDGTTRGGSYSTLDDPSCNKADPLAKASSTVYVGFRCCKEPMR